jgi:hypothetical protein
MSNRHQRESATGWPGSDRQHRTRLWDKSHAEQADRQPSPSQPGTLAGRDSRGSVDDRGAGDASNGVSRKWILAHRSLLVRGGSGHDRGPSFGKIAGGRYAMRRAAASFL